MWQLVVDFGSGLMMVLGCGTACLILVVIGVALFRREPPTWELKRDGPAGPERVVVTLSGPYAPAEIREKHQQILARFVADGWRLVRHPELWPDLRRTSDDQMPQ